MNIFDFITQDELDELPEDPQLAFAELVRHAQRRLADYTRDLEHQENWPLLREARHGFMNVVVAAGRRYGIEPFATMDVPRYKKFDNDEYFQFKADLDHYMTQLLIDNSIRGKRDSVFIEQKTKDRIRQHLHNLRSCIENANISEGRKRALLNRVDDLESELNRRRVSLLTVAKVAFEILALPAGVWGSVEIAQRLTTNIMQAVGEAKVIEDEARRLPPVTTPIALAPPRREQPQNQKVLEDDIPF